MDELISLFKSETEEILKEYGLDKYVNTCHYTKDKIFFIPFTNIELLIKTYNNGTFSLSYRDRHNSYYLKDMNEASILMTIRSCIHNIVLDLKKVFPHQEDEVKTHRLLEELIEEIKYSPFNQRRMAERQLSFEKGVRSQSSAE